MTEQPFFEGQLPVLRRPAESNGINSLSATQMTGQIPTSMQGMMPAKQERPPITNELDLAYEEKKLLVNAQLKAMAMQSPELARNYNEIQQNQSAMQMLRYAVESGFILKLIIR